jgi:hypothetical protein
LTVAAKPFIYVVDVETPERAREDLLRIWGENLRLAYGAEEKFDWIYRRAPRRPDRVFMLRASSDTSPVRTVGTAGIGLRRFQVGERVADAAVLVDLAVDKEHRGLVPALKLVRSVRSAALGKWDLAYGFPNQSAIGVFRRARYRPLDTFGRYARLLRHENYLQRIAELPRVPKQVGRMLSWPLAPAIAAAILDAGRLVYDAPRIAAAAHRYRLRWPDRADERCDELWQRVRGQYRIVGERSAELLRWRFPRERGFRVAYLEARGDGRLAAYAVLQRSERFEAIVDLFGEPAALGPLMDRLALAATFAGAEVLSFDFMGTRRMTDVLSSRGFRRVEVGRTVVYDFGEDVAPSERDLAGDPQSWFLTDADEDE